MLPSTFKKNVAVTSVLILSTACGSSPDTGDGPVGGSSSPASTEIPTANTAPKPPGGGAATNATLGGADQGAVNTGGGPASPVPIPAHSNTAGNDMGVGPAATDNGVSGAGGTNPAAPGEEGGEPSGGSGGEGSSGGSGGAPPAGGANQGGIGGEGIGGEGNPDPNMTGSTFRVSGRNLFDRCGEQVVLRGVNEMIVWSGGKDGNPEFAEIAKTGANSVRIVWTEEGIAAELDTAITNAVDQQLIPMIEHHGATGNLNGVPAVVDYWTRDDIVATLTKHEPHLLLNIANEAGAAETQGNFEDTYRQAITRIRQTGVRMPLVIDAPQWGQDIDMLQAAGPTLIEHDPEHNLLFSVHMWWNDPDGNRVVSELNESVEQGLPLIVGEFAQHAVGQCDNEPFAYAVLLAEAQKHGIGWLAWSWGSVGNSDCADRGSFDMTVDGVFGNWEEPWSEAVALTDPNSIQNTSVRPRSMVEGSCEP